MDPLTMGLISQVPNVIKSGIGIYQMAKGARMAANAQRPDYEIPQEILDNLSQSELMALEGMPAEQKKQFVDNIQRGIQAGMRGLKDRSAGLQGIGGLVQQQMDQYRNMFSQDAAQRIQNIAQVQQNRGTLANYKDKQFKLNELDPYLNQVAAAEAMKGAGLQNIMGGVQSAGNMLLDQYNYNRFLEMNTPVTEEEQTTTQQTVVPQNVVPPPTTPQTTVPMPPMNTNPYPNPRNNDWSWSQFGSLNLQ